jgi:hypothetical protein
MGSLPDQRCQFREHTESLQVLQSAKNATFQDVSYCHQVPLQRAPLIIRLQGCSLPGPHRLVQPHPTA